MERKLRISEYKSLMRSRRQDIRRVWYGDSGTTYVEGLLGKFEISLKPGVGNRPVITHAHLIQVDQIA